MTDRYSSAAPGARDHQSVGQGPERAPDDRKPSAGCGLCRQRRDCLPQALAGDELAAFAAVVQEWRALAGGRLVFRQGAPCHAVFALKAGSVKLTQISAGGSETVLGFAFAPSIIGVDGISDGSYDCSAVALEHCAVCEIPFDALCRLSEYVAPLQRNLFRVLSQAIVAEQKLATVLSTGDATQRLVAFLLHMAAQNQRRGLSAKRMTLPMSRHDIGNFLGMTLETVSRLFSRLAERGWIRVTRREITLLDPDALATAANHLRL